MSIVKPFLRSRGIDQLQTIVLTHGDIQHVKATNVSPKNSASKPTVTSGAKSRSPKYREILRALEERPQSWRKVASGDALGAWKVIHPPLGADFSKADDEAIVLTGNVGKTRLLLLSDLAPNRPGPTCRSRSRSRHRYLRSQPSRSLAPRPVGKSETKNNRPHRPRSENSKSRRRAHRHHRKAFIPIFNSFAF